MKRFALAVTVALCLPPPGAAFGASAGSPGKSACRPQPASAVPVPLTSSQCGQASRIVANDPYLHKLLAGVKYTVSRPDPWGGNGNHDLGAVFRIRLSKKLYASRTVDGLAANHLHGALVAIPYWGILFLAGTGDMWLDPTTNLPMELVVTNPNGSLEMKIYFSWLPRTSDVTANTALVTPPGYKHTPSSGLPHIFGD